MLGQIEIRKEILEDPMYNNLFTVETVNKLIIEDGMTFRDAYKKVGELVENGDYVPDRDLKHTHLGSIGNLGNELIVKKMEKALLGVRS